MARATINTTQLARLLLMTPRHVNRMVADGVLTRATDDDGTELRGRFEMVANVQAYIRHLQARNQHDEPGESVYSRLRNDRMRDEGEMTRLRLAEIKGKLHRADDVEFAVTAMVSACRARLLAIPSRIATRLIGKRSFKEIYSIIYNEIVSALKELSGYEAKKFRRSSDQFLAQNGAGAHENENESETDRRTKRRA